MERTLLCGPAGSGKTRRVLDEVRPLLAPGAPEAPGADGGLRRFLVVVPTYSQAEHLKRRLLRLSPAPGLLDRGVVTFEQLAERRTGIRLASLAPAAVRDAVLAAALAERDEPAFRDVARFPGLRRAALRFLDEVKALEPDPDADVVAVAADRIAAAADSLPEQRRTLVRALVAVLAAYERRRRAEGLLDHGDLLRELLRLLRAGPAGRYELFVLDGFTDLTAVQEAIVHHLSAASDRSLVTLTGDGARRAASPFDAGERLRARLVDAGFRVEDAGPTRRFLDPALARLERRLAGDEVQPAPPSAAVRFLAGADPDDEADRVARTVLRWTTEGIARSDILVVVRSLASETAARVLDALRTHRVPSRRLGGEPLAAVPCVRSSLRALRLLAGSADTYELVEALRHGDAAGVADRDGDRIDLAVRERGAADEAGLLELADACGATSARAWIDALRSARPGAAPRPPATVADALFGALPRLLRFRFAAPFDDADEAAVARDAAAMRALREVAAHLVAALRAAGAPALSAADLVARLEAVVETSRFSPPDHRDDVVHVVDAEEARQWEARAVVVAGLRLGEFPPTAREDLFLSDEERAAVERSSGLRLPRRRDDALRRESLLFYSAATRARERVVLTCPAADESGNPVLRSPFLERALEVVPEGDRVLDGAERSSGDVRPAPGETLHRADLERTALAALTERFAAGRASEIRPHTGYALLPHLLAAPDPVVRAAARWFASPEASLREDGPARLALAVPRVRSASSLGDFAQCPFRHFARKGLRLEEIRGGVEDGVDALLAGEIAHKVLERAVERRIEDAGAIEALVEEVFREKAGRVRRDLRVEAVRTELRRTLVERVRALVAAGGVVGGFRPVHLEWEFGREGPRVAVGPPDAPVELTGAADRIDVDDAGRAIVVDYKWSLRARYSGIERRIEEGSDLQLPIYALAAGRALGLRVVAVGYLTLRDGEEKWIPVTEDAPVPGPKRPAAGWGTGDGAEGLAAAEARIVSLDLRIRAGECVAAPRDEDKCGAARCPYADLCRFEGQPE